MDDGLHAKLTVGEGYSKGPTGDLPDLIGEPTLRNIREGIFYCTNTPRTTIFFVTLVKKDRPIRFHFDDYFEGNLFHWDSQPQQDFETPRIREIRGEDWTTLLFTRVHQKIKGRTQQFIYCGRLRFHEHDPNTSKPVHLVFRSLDHDDRTDSQALREIYAWTPEHSVTSNTEAPSESAAISGEEQKHEPPDHTERSGLVTSRVGQGWYRDALLEKWEGKCPVTGVERRSILIASHIVPWKEATDEERLDPENGILLSPDVDALFDSHLISFGDDGQLVLSAQIEHSELTALGIDQDRTIPVSNKMKSYLSRHRQAMEDRDREEGRGVRRIKSGDEKPAFSDPLLDLLKG